MTLLVAIEGADGAGKATAAANMLDALVDRGMTATVISFPRYGRTVGGVALGEFLAGRLPVPVTPRAAAVLYALDRLESVAFVSQAVDSHDVVLLDRYVASNMVYQASKVDERDASTLMHWIYQLEVDTFGITPPDLSFYLDTPLELARELMLLKERRSYTDRQFDEHEADLALQRSVRRNYASIAGSDLAGPWHVIRTAKGRGLREPQDIAEEMVGHVLALLGRTSGSRQRVSNASLA